MANESQIQAVQKLVKRGSVRHADITPALQKEGLGNIDADEVVNLIVRHKYSAGTGAAAQMRRRFRIAGDKVGGYVGALLGAVVVAEFRATQALSESLIADKLQGFGDHLRYWLGRKTVEVSGPEMIDALGDVVAATPQIVRGMVVGAVLGYLVWKGGSRLVGHFYRKQQLQKDIERLVG